MNTPATRPYAHGLQELGTGLHAWLQPDGSWGWSNAGLVSDGGESLLVDTLFDCKLTAEMLAAMRAAIPAAARIATVVNTHSNGDHCNGNSLLPEAEIVASEATALEMPHESPALMLEYRKAAPALTLVVGAKRVELVCVGPAHTRGDTLVHVPADRAIFTGDILFIEGHPIMWAGPIANWIAACERILALDVETVVPGHGPVTDKRGVLVVRDYLAYVRDQARLRFDAGLPFYEAALDISLPDYSSWGNAERIVVNVAALYREFANDSSAPEIATLFGLMARIRREQRK